MENKFLAIIIVYVIIASSGLAMMTAESTINLSPALSQNINFSKPSNVDYTIEGDYKINGTYGIYSDSIEKFLGSTLNPVIISFPIRADDSDNTFALKIHIHNPDKGEYKITYTDNPSNSMDYWVSGKGNTFSVHSGFGNLEEFNIIDYTDYDIIIVADEKTKTTTITLPNKQIDVKNVNAIAASQYGKIELYDNNVYVSSLETYNDSEPDTSASGFLTQLGLILAWNVEGLPVAINLIFIKVPLLCIAIAAFQLIRGN